MYVAIVVSGVLHWLFFFFFFQAEDGIRDIGVTGVQTCALPIWGPRQSRCHSLLIKRFKSQGGRFEFQRLNVPSICARQQSTAGTWNYQATFCGHILLERLPAVPSAVDCKQIHSALVRWFSRGLDD